MKENWLNLVEQIQRLIDDNAAVINGLRNGPDVTKIRKNFERSVKSLSKQIEEFSMFVPDPEADEIELPFESPEFESSWSEYKDFLYQVFGIVLVPVEEKRRLKKLYNISKKNEERALEYIDFYICSRYKSVFLPKDFQHNSEEETEEKTPDHSFTLKKTTI